MSKSIGVVGLLATAAVLASAGLACSPTLPRSEASACLCACDWNTAQAGDARATSAPDATPVDPSIQPYIAREFKVEDDAPLPRANE